MVDRVKNVVALRTHRKSPPPTQHDVSSDVRVIVRQLYWLNVIIEHDVIRYLHQADVIADGHAVVVTMYDDRLDGVVLAAYVEIVCSNHNLHCQM